MKRQCPTCRYWFAAPAALPAVHIEIWAFPAQERAKAATIEVPKIVTALARSSSAPCRRRYRLNRSRPTPIASRPSSPFRLKPAKILPPGLLPEAPEEHERRGDAADALFRAVTAGATGKRP